ncbi:hypothetical protein TNCV_2377071 [Trichonephila clavipes]|nr:hypothetical protein TNCV_2377071 [Trichonephila clavipes]
MRFVQLPNEAAQSLYGQESEKAGLSDGADLGRFSLGVGVTLKGEVEKRFTYTLPPQKRTHSPFPNIHNPYPSIQKWTTCVEKLTMKKKEEMEGRGRGTPGREGIEISPEIKS